MSASLELYDLSVWISTRLPWQPSIVQPGCWHCRAGPSCMRNWHVRMAPTRSGGMLSARNSASAWSCNANASLASTGSKSAVANGPSTLRMTGSMA